MGANVGCLTAKKDKKSDEYYTPDYAIWPILEFIKKEWIIWCPFDEKNSQFVKILKNNGNKVIYSHINQGKDFFVYKPKVKYDIIISNPPFSIKDKVLKRCYELDKKFMLLLPLPSLQSKERFKYFIKGLELLVFDGRINYFSIEDKQKIKLGNSFASCYFCYNVLPEKLIFKKLNLKKEI